MTDFRNFDEKEFVNEMIELGEFDGSESKLDIVETFAVENGLICNEEELSEIFDVDVIPSLREQWLKRSDYPDYPMINEAFNNWTDMLCRDHLIHEEQYNEYCYVGKYENDV